MSNQEHRNGVTKAVEIAKLAAEIIWLHVRVWFTILQSIYTFFLPPELKDVSGEVVLITGAGHGMGQAMALRFARLRSTVICVDINPKGNEETVNMIKRENGNVHSYQCDVTDRSAVMQLAEKVRKEVGDVSILVNNAGIMPCRSLLDHSEKEIRLMNDVNINGNLWMLQAFLPAMMKRNYGQIVAMASIAGLVGSKNMVPYCGSKYAIRGIMHALAVELRQSDEDYSGIKLTTVYPYMVNTGLYQKARYRFGSLLKPVETDFAAGEILNGIRRNYVEITVPAAHWYLSYRFSEMIPINTKNILYDFLNTGVEPHEPNQFN